MDIDLSRLEEKKNLLAASLKELSAEIDTLTLEEKTLRENLEKTHEALKELEKTYSAQEKENARLMEEIEHLIDQRTGCEEEITKDICRGRPTRIRSDPHGRRPREIRGRTRQDRYKTP